MKKFGLANKDRKFFFPFEPSMLVLDMDMHGDLIE